MTRNQKRPCPHCGKSYYPTGFAKHVPACKLRPADDDLRRLYDNDGMTLLEIGGELGVSVYMVKVWLKELGIDTRGREYRRKLERPTAVRGSAAREMCAGGCKGSEWFGICHERERRNGPVLCEAALVGDEETSWQASGWLRPERRG